MRPPHRAHRAVPAHEKEPAETGDLLVRGVLKRERDICWLGYQDSNLE